MATALTTPGVWSAHDTSPPEIEAALLELMHERAGEGVFQAPARVLNLVVVIDHEFKGEISNRLDRISRENPTRTILVIAEEDKEDLDARATLVHDTPGELGGNTVFRERVEIVCGSEDLAHLDSVVYPVLANDVGTVIWSPHGHPEAVDSLCDIAETVLVDSHDFDDWRSAIVRMRELSERLVVSDLAWLRSMPWRERTAATFDPLVWRSELDAIERVVVRMHPESTMSALLFLGWLVSRLEWQPQVMELDDPGARRGHAAGPAGQIELAIEDDQTMPVPGLAGLTIETANGISLSLNRAAGGLRAQRDLADGTQHGWTVLGASRGEDGILAHGLTHALFPDDLFEPALDAACALGGRASLERGQGHRR